MSPTSYRTAPPRVTRKKPNVSIAPQPRPRRPHVRRAPITAILSLAAAAALVAQAPTAPRPQTPTVNVVRTADPIKRGLKETDCPRTMKVADNVYTYEDFHAGDEKFTTTNLFMVTDEGVLVADGQGSPAATAGLVNAIRSVTPKPIKYVVIGSDHRHHTAGNAAFPAGITYIVHPTSKTILDRAGGRGNTGGTNGSWRLPDDAVLVSDRQSFTLGGQTFDVLFLGRAHTSGDLAVRLPERR